jgi:hypothetical protein
MYEGGQGAGGSGSRVGGVDQADMLSRAMFLHMYCTFFLLSRHGAWGPSGSAAGGLYLCTTSSTRQAGHTNNWAACLLFYRYYI